MRLCIGVISQILYWCRGTGVNKRRIVEAFVKVIDTNAVIAKDSEKKKGINANITHYDISDAEITRVFNCTSNFTGAGSRSKKTSESKGFSNVLTVAKTVDTSFVKKAFYDVFIKKQYIKEDCKKNLILALLDVIEQDSIIDLKNAESFKKYVGKSRADLLSAKGKENYELSGLLAGVFLYSATSVENSDGRDKKCNETSDSCKVNSLINEATNKFRKNYMSNGLMDTALRKASHECGKGCVLRITPVYINDFEKHKDTVSFVNISNNFNFLAKEKDCEFDLDVDLKANAVALKANETVKNKTSVENQYVSSREATNIVLFDNMTFNTAFLQIHKNREFRKKVMRSCLSNLLMSIILWDKVEFPRDTCDILNLLEQDHKHDSIHELLDICKPKKYKTFVLYEHNDKFEDAHDIEKHEETFKHSLMARTESYIEIGAINNINYYPHPDRVPYAKQYVRNCSKIT